MLQVSVNDKNNFEIAHEEGKWIVNGIETDCDISQQPNGLVSVLLNGKSYTAIIEKTTRSSKEVVVRVNGQQYTSTVKEPIDLLLTNMGIDMKARQKIESIKAPMPGMVLKVLVTPGQQINKGDSLIILEAMKMENILKAAAPGTVKSIKAVEKVAVEKGAVLIEME